MEEKRDESQRSLGRVIKQVEVGRDYTLIEMLRFGLVLDGDLPDGTEQFSKDGEKYIAYQRSGEPKVVYNIVAHYRKGYWSVD